MRKTYMQIDGELIEKPTRRVRPAYTVQGDIEPYKSPIDGTIITSRSQEREHMRRHDVCHADDFSPEYMARKTRERELRAAGQLPEQIRERTQQVADAYYGRVPLRRPVNE